MASSNRFLNPRTLAALFWYAVGLLVLLLYLQWTIRADYLVLPFPGLVVIAGLLVLAVFFPLMHALVRSYRTDTATAAPPAHAAVLYFPLPPTVTVGIWLLVFSVVCVVGLFMTLVPQSPLMQTLGLAGTTPGNNDEIIKESLLTLFAAGIGSSITTILGYLQHASEKRDFSRAFVPWYVGRPVMGMLLGLIFYFVLKGGMLATVTADTGAAAVSNLNDGALAAIAGLVGLFSKNAIEKLRQVFQTLFQVPGENGEDPQKGGAPGGKPKAKGKPTGKGSPAVTPKPKAKPQGKATPKDAGKPKADGKARPKDAEKPKEERKPKSKDAEKGKEEGKPKPDDAEKPKPDGAPKDKGKPGIVDGGDL